GKAGGIDEIRPEMLKALDGIGAAWLTRIFQVAWDSGEVPLDWTTGVIVPIFKRGDKSDCNNYRGITLLSLPGKAYAKVLEARLRTVAEPLGDLEDDGLTKSNTYANARPLTPQG